MLEKFKNARRHVAVYLTASISGLLFGLGMFYLTFSRLLESKNVPHVLSVLFDSTLGLPVIVSGKLASLYFIKKIICEENSYSTFGCWSSGVLIFSVLAYGLLFFLCAYLFKTFKSDKNN